MAYLHITQAWDLSVHSNPYSNQNDLSELFDQTFNVIPAMKPEDLEEVYKLRYQVYCLERNFHDPADYKHKQEIDPFDARSVYTLLQHKKSGEFIGTARLVLADRHNLHVKGYNHFPAQAVTSQDLAHDRSVFPLNKTAEISRICFSQYKAQNLDLSSMEKRLILPGLLRGINQLRDLHDVDQFIALLENRLIKRADQLGFSPNEVGLPVEHKGTRYLAHYDCHQTLENIKQKNEAVWNIVSADGKYCPNGNPPTISDLTPSWAGKDNTAFYSHD